MNIKRDDVMELVIKADSAHPFVLREEGILSTGASMRQYYAAHAPVTLQEAMLATGFKWEDLRSDEKRAALFATLALMRNEYAEAMLREVK